MFFATWALHYKEQLADVTKVAAVQAERDAEVAAVGVEEVEEVVEAGKQSIIAFMRHNC